MRIFLAGATRRRSAPGSCRCWSPPATGSRHHPLAREGRARCAPRAPTPWSSTPRPRRGRRRDRRRAARRDRAPAHRLAGLTSLRDFDPAFALTNRLRTEGTDHLLEGAGRPARAASSPSPTPGWPYARDGRAGQDRGRPARPEPVPSMRGTLDADPPPRGHVPEAGGIVLRYGGFYSPGTARARRRATRGWSASAASRSSATAAASGRSSTSTTPPRRRSPRSSAARRGSTTSSTTTPRRSAWLPALAGAAGAKPPRRIPRWLARIAAGEAVATI